MTRKTIVLGSICVLAQEKSTWFSPFTSGTIRSSSTSVAVALSSWISTRSRTGSVMSFTRAIRGFRGAPMQRATYRMLSGKPHARSLDGGRDWYAFRHLCRS